MQFFLASSFQKFICNISERSRAAGITLWLAMMGVANAQSLAADMDTPPFNTLYKWKQVDFDFPTPKHRRHAIATGWANYLCTIAVTGASSSLLCLIWQQLVLTLHALRSTELLRSNITKWLPIHRLAVSDGLSDRSLNSVCNELWTCHFLIPSFTATWQLRVK